ncbi:MAG: hypothetical protein ACPGOV_12370 [Magnetovibrionaceae bacterium]
MTIEPLAPDPRIERALGYPYRIPEISFALHRGAVSVLEGAFETVDRVPVLASGSNQSPDQLKRKFGPDEPDPVISEAATLKDFDSVYSAHITRYGSVAATLWPSEGTLLPLFINWLTARQLERMHETEALGVNYRFGWLEGVEIETARGFKLDQAATYVSLAGALCLNNSPVALQALVATRRLYPALDQAGVQDAIRQGLGHRGARADFILGNIENPDNRKQTRQALAGRAQPFPLGIRATNVRP